MTITHKKSFLYHLFPEVKQDEKKLTEAVKRYYSVGPFEPTVTTEEDFIHIEIGVDRIQADKKKFDKLVSVA